MQDPTVAGWDAVVWRTDSWWISRRWAWQVVGGTGLVGSGRCFARPGAVRAHRDWIRQQTQR